MTNPDAAGDASIAADARALLATLPTARLAMTDSGVRFTVLDRATRYLPRDVAENCLLKLLADLLADGEQYLQPGVLSRPQDSVRRAVQQLDRWHNLNLGGLGTGGRRASGRDGVDWRAAATETLKHFARQPAG